VQPRLTLAVSAVCVPEFDQRPSVYFRRYAAERLHIVTFTTPLASHEYSFWARENAAAFQ
jgi:hypothetical protein